MRTLSNKIINNLVNNSTLKNIGFKENKNWNWKSNQQLLNAVINCREELKERKIDVGDRVAYKGKNSVNWIAWNLATNSLGAAWVPMYSDQSKKYSDFIIKDCSPKVLIQDGKEKHDNTEVISNEINYGETLGKDIDFANPVNGLSTLIYTSGTTGNPKGVMLTNENLTMKKISHSEYLRNVDLTFNSLSATFALKRSTLDLHDDTIASILDLMRKGNLINPSWITVNYDINKLSKLIILELGTIISQAQISNHDNDISAQRKNLSSIATLAYLTRSLLTVYAYQD